MRCGGGSARVCWGLYRISILVPSAWSKHRLSERRHSTTLRIWKSYPSTFCFNYALRICFWGSPKMLQIAQLVFFSDSAPRVQRSQTALNRQLYTSSFDWLITLVYKLFAGIMLYMFVSDSSSREIKMYFTLILCPYFTVFIQRRSWNAFWEIICSIFVQTVYCVLSAMQGGSLSLQEMYAALQLKNENKNPDALTFTDNF